MKWITRIIFNIFVARLEKLCAGAQALPDDPELGASDNRVVTS